MSASKTDGAVEDTLDPGVHRDAGSGQKISEPALFRDKVLGILFGAAIGDALGVLTEFEQSREQASALVDGLPEGKLGFTGWPTKDSGKRRSAPVVDEGDWTDDTDQQIMLVQSLLAGGGQINTADFAARMRLWERQGLEAMSPELGKSVAIGIGNTTALVISHPLFVSADSAHAGLAAMHWWLAPEPGASARDGSANGSTMRTAILGSLLQPRAATLAYSRTTHASPHADAAVVAVTEAIRSLVHEGADPATARDNAVCESIAQLATSLQGLPLRVEHLLHTLRDGLPANLGEAGLPDVNQILTGEARAYYVNALTTVWNDRRDDIAQGAAAAADQLRNKLQTTSLAALHLTETPIGDCSKTAGCGMWALTQGMQEGGGGAEGFRHAITAITREGGDADTNATVAGALMGAHLGFRQLPQDWVSGLKHGDWLLALGEDLCSCLTAAGRNDGEMVARFMTKYALGS